MARNDFSFTHSLRVRWAEVDLQAIVFNGNYLTYFDVAFTEYWRMTGLKDPIAQSKDGLEMFAKKATIEFHAPASFDDVLEIGVRCSELGRTSMRFVIEIFKGEEHLISGEMVYVYADSKARKSTPIPDEWRNRFLEIEQSCPIK
jgi:acyl-CoA thioester hydrolase